MNYFVNDTHTKPLEGNYLTAKASDEDEAAAVLAADFSRWADDVSPETEMMIESSNKQKTGDLPADFGQISFMCSDNLSLKALSDSNHCLLQALDAQRSMRMLDNKTSLRNLS